MVDLSFTSGEKRRKFTCLQWYRGILCGGLFLVMVSGCTTAPELKTSPVLPSVSAEIIETLKMRESHVKSLKGLFHAEIEGKGMVFAHSFEGTILYQRPDQFRIKGFTRLGGVVFDFVLSQDFYALRVKDQPKPILGGMDNFQELGDLRLPVLLSLRAIEALLGKIRLSDNQIPILVQQEKVYLLDIPSDSRIDESTLSQHILIDQDSLQVRQLDYLDVSRESVVSIRSSDFRRVRDSSPSEPQALHLPFVVHAEDRIQAGSITLEFMEIIANESLDETLFTLAAF